MGDNDTLTCPMQSFSTEFPSTNSNSYNSENQKSIEQNNEKKGNKEESSEQLNFQSSPLPKKMEENPDSQDCLTNPDLPNGHNNPDAINIGPRGKSLGELLEESEELPDTLMSDYSSKVKETEDNSEKDSETKEKVESAEQENSNVASLNSQDFSEQGKTPEDSVSQDFFDERKDETSSNEKNEQSNNSNQDTEFSEGFDLHLSETQSFSTSTEKGRENQQLVSESEEESQSAVEAEKVTESVNVQAEDVEMSNGSSSNHDSNKESTHENANSNEASETENAEIDKSETNKEVAEESLSNGEAQETKEEENVEEINDNEKINEQQIDTEEANLVINDQGNKTEEVKESKLDKEEDEKTKVEPESNIIGAMEVENTKEEARSQPEVTRVSSRQRQRKQIKEEQKKVEQQKDETEALQKEESAKEQKSEAMEVDSSANEANSEPEEPDICSCEPGCHKRIQAVSRHLSNACSQLDEFIKLKRREENKLLKSFLDMLKEISDISENKEIKGVSKISEHILIPEETPVKRKAPKRKSNDLDTPLKETPRKRAAEEKVGKKSVEKEKKLNEEFKDVKGLAVFAKWPNSGWYYPGKVEELIGANWKEANNVTVKFYDGLVREMKNIHILPAYLIPVGSLLCDLEDETEMTVLDCDGSNQNSVDFKLSTKDSNDPVEMNFNKLAIRALHMKSIKQQLEPTTDVAPKKMHMVSLDNLVSGRRSRVRSKKDDSDSEEKTPIQTERRSRGVSTPTPAKKPSTPRRARN